MRSTTDRVRRPQHDVAHALVLSCSLVLGLSANNGASAQPSGEQKAAAEALFDRGLQLMRDGKFSEACQQLEASQALDRGIGTMLYLAECYEKLGRTASAWAMFREASSAAEAGGQQERAAAGAERARLLEPRLSTLTIEVPEAHRVPDLEVRRNGAPAPAPSWSVPVPVDPGVHRISATAPGYASWEQEVRVGHERSALIATVPALVPVGPSPLPPPAEPAPQDGEPMLSVTGFTPDSADSDDSGDALRLTGLVVAGVGVAAIGVGAVFGLDAIGKNDDSQKLCPEPGPCASARGVELNQKAQDAATLANVFVIGGAAVAATGVLLYVLAPSTERPPVALSLYPEAAMLHVGGVF